MKNYTQLCVWPGTLLGDNTPDDFEQFIKNELGVKVKYYTEIITKPDLDKDGNYIPDTGGRNDLFFYVHDEDVAKFALPRLQMGIRWWEDVIKYNDNSHLYDAEFIKSNPPTW